ncbi:MAG: hypothetical protein ACOYL5_09375 [Phototrophicaceae bacterium]|jgi:hypothetical protein
MTFEEILQAVDQLPHDQKARLKDHLEQSDAVKKQADDALYQQLEAIWRQYPSPPLPEPKPVSMAEFAAAIDAFREGFTEEELTALARLAEEEG